MWGNTYPKEYIGKIIIRRNHDISHLTITVRVLAQVAVLQRGVELPEVASLGQQVKVLVPEAGRAAPACGRGGTRVLLRQVAVQAGAQLVVGVA